MRPKASTASSTMLLAPSRSATDALLATASPPRAFISATTASAASPSPVPSTPPPRSLTTTLAPRLANSMAWQRPMPPPAPVTAATLPWNSLPSNSLMPSPLVMPPACRPFAGRPVSRLTPERIAHYREARYTIVPGFFAAMEIAAREREVDRWAAAGLPRDGRCAGVEAQPAADIPPRSRRCPWSTSNRLPAAWAMLDGSQPQLEVPAVSEPVRILPCPTCRKPVPWSSSNRHRPFCSERCRLIDFGDWVEERHRIPGEKSPDAASDDQRRD